VEAEIGSGGSGWFCGSENWKRRKWLDFSEAEALGWKKLEVKSKAWVFEELEKKEIKIRLLVYIFLVKISKYWDLLPLYSFLVTYCGFVDRVQADDSDSVFYRVDWRDYLSRIHFFFYKHKVYKHKVYKHTEPDFWWKIKHMLSITPASLNLINPLELRAFINDTNAIFALLTKFTNQ